MLCLLSCRSVPWIVAIGIAPIAAILINKFNFQILFASISIIILILIHLSFLYTNISTIIPYIGLGIVFAIFPVAIFSIVPLIESCVADDMHIHIEMQYKIVLSCIYISLTIIPLSVAGLFAISQLYIPNVEIFYLSFSIVAFVLILYIAIYDYFTGKRIQKGFFVVTGSSINLSQLSQSHGFGSNRSINSQESKKNTKIRRAWNMILLIGKTIPEIFPLLERLEISGKVFLMII